MFAVTPVEVKVVADVKPVNVFVAALEVKETTVSISFIVKVDPVAFAVIEMAPVTF